MAAYDRYRPIVDPDTGRPALVCDDCRDPEGWPGVRVWTAPETAAFDLADQINAVDEHERTYHPTGCRHEPYDCNCDNEED
jgi:hypothetical protein